MLGKAPHRLKIVVRCFHKKNLHVKLLTKSSIIKKERNYHGKKSQKFKFLKIKRKG